MAAEFIFEFPLPLGLHARPASFIQEKCQSFAGQVTWENLRTKRRADAKSALSLVTSDTQHHDRCRVVVEGNGEKEFAEELKKFLLSELPAKEEQALKMPEAAAAIVPRLVRDKQEVYFTGQPASAGVAIGRVMVLKAGTGLDELGGLENEKSENPKQEIEIFRKALAALTEEIKKGLEEKTGVEKNILKAHLSIASDP
ncbi:MAG: HPr family phosphocarrier protein, partial [Candidatus Saccharicenans sp.]